MDELKQGQEVFIITEFPAMETAYKSYRIYKVQVEEINTDHIVVSRSNRVFSRRILEPSMVYRSEEEARLSLALKGIVI